MRSKCACVIGALATAACGSAVWAGPNLMMNPGAEAGAAGGVIPGWNYSGTFEVVAYDTPGGFPLSSDPGSPNRGDKFFSGGGSASVSTALQTVILSGFASEIDSGALAFTLSGYLGGFASQDDHCDVRADFYDGAGAVILGTASIGGVRAVERGSQTGMLYREASGPVPIGTRQVLIIVTMTREAGQYNDGYADDLSFSMRATCPCDLNGDGQVDDADFELFVAAYNTLDCADPEMAPGCPADFDGNGVVEDGDFTIFVAAYNELVCP